MPRVKNSLRSHKRRKRVLKEAKGFRGARGRLVRLAQEAVERSLATAYRDRRIKKRTFRNLWITRINGAVRPYGLSYSQFMGSIKSTGIGLDRKSLADLAVHDPEGFRQIVERSQA